ncbi:MAG: hypothetical protein IPP17_04375, partial [Bacteroidetes bacterium]|nr:hypothetical protein [Bacteroidota bacterium]
GYGWVSYDYHKIFCGEVLVIRALQFARGLGGENNVWNPAGYQLKVLPYRYDSPVLKMHVDGAELSLVWTGEGRPEALTEVTNRVIDANGKQIEEKSGYVQGIFAGEGDKMGYPANVLDGKFAFKGTKWTIEVAGKSSLREEFCAEVQHRRAGECLLCWAVTVVDILIGHATIGPLSIPPRIEAGPLVFRHLPRTNLPPDPHPNTLTV